MTQPMLWRPRHLTAALVFAILAGCAPPTPSIAPSGSPAALQPSGSVETAEPPSPSASAEPDGPAPFPSDVVSEIDAILDASTLEQAMAATRIVLERSGVVVTDDPASAGRPPSGLYIGTDELATMAHEAQSRAGLSHVTFAEFAETFAGLALLPPNDGLLARLSEPGATPDPAADVSVTLDLDEQAARLAEVLTSWVNRSLENHPSDDPAMTALTAPALYLAELATRQDLPIDLREPFLPSRLELGPLDVTLLVAGLRTSLALSAQTATASALPGVHADRSNAGPAAFGVPPTACGEVMRILDGQVQLLVGVPGGPAITALARFTIGQVLRRAGDLGRGVLVAWEALGIIFRVQLLWLLYHDTEVTLLIDPPTIHKPVGNNELVQARLTAGIPDAAWEKALADRANNPTTENLKACARALGIPVTADLVDVGEATSTWRVAWEITRGNEHARFEGCQFLESCDSNAVASGRHERKLTKRDDHSAMDNIIVEILPERESDHPGREVQTPLRVCAHVRTDKPPSVTAILKAGTAGVAGTTLLGGAILASSVANILLGWWQFVFTIDKCAITTVSFHVPKPGNWQGTITVNTEYYESTTVTRKNYTGTSRRSYDITDVYYVGGDDTGQVEGRIRLDAHMFIRGGERSTMEEHSLQGNASLCRYTKDYVSSFGGSWNLESDAEVEINLQPNGKYQIFFGPTALVNDVLLPYTETTTLADAGSPFECTGLGTTGREYDQAPNGIYAGTYLIEDSVASAFPGSVLKGRMTIRDPNDLRAYTTVEWNLTRDTPIILPVQQGGGGG